MWILLKGNVNFRKRSEFSEDFDRSWYSVVGSKVINTWLINVVSPHLVYLIITPLLIRMKRKKAKNAIIQKDANDCYMGRFFDLVSKYALLLNTIFVTLFFSSMMPLMLLLGASSLFFQYISEKIMRIFLF